MERRQVDIGHNSYGYGADTPVGTTMGLDLEVGPESLEVQSGIQNILGDARALPFRKGGLDKVTSEACIGGLYPAGADDVAIEEAYEALKPGGVFRVATHINDQGDEDHFKGILQGVGFVNIQRRFLDGDVSSYVDEDELAFVMFRARKPL